MSIFNTLYSCEQSGINCFRRAISHHARNKAPLDILSEKVLPNSFIENTQRFKRSHITDYTSFFKMTYENKYRPSRARNELPEVATDIKGIDLSAYRYIWQSLKKMPVLFNCIFFRLVFIPDLHFLCLSRKSTVAYAFTNRGGYVLNDVNLENAWTKYNGEYKKASFFQVKLSPLDTAVGRSKFRKLLRRTLFQELKSQVKTNSDFKKCKGIFFFQLLVVPKDENDKKQIRKNLSKAVKVLLSSKEFMENAQQVCVAQNKNKTTIKNLLKGIKKYNTYGATNVPGYYEKLPFIKNYTHYL